jgi:hypothetical protein
MFANKYAKKKPAEVSSPRGKPVRQAELRTRHAPRPTTPPREKKSPGWFKRLASQNQSTNSVNSYEWVSQEAARIERGDPTPPPRTR